MGVLQLKLQEYGVPFVVLTLYRLGSCPILTIAISVAFIRRRRRRRQR